MRSSLFRLISIVTILFLSAIISGCVSSPRDSGEALNVGAEGYALSGADVVAYFSLERDANAAMGSEQHAYTWRGATWLFSTAENRDAFADDPEQFMPNYGGYCSYAMSQDDLVNSDPDAWTVRDGELYLFARKKGRSNWRENPVELIDKADLNWPEHKTRLLEEE